MSRLRKILNSGLIKKYPVSFNYLNCVFIKIINDILFQLLSDTNIILNCNFTIQLNVTVKYPEKVLELS